MHSFDHFYFNNILKTDCSRPDFDNYAGPDGSTPSGGTVNLKCKDGYGLNTDSQERLCTNGNYFPDFVNSPAACLQSILCFFDIKHFLLKKIYLKTGTSFNTF